MPRSKANGVEIEYETFGDPAGETILLINGLGSQMTRWPAAFCEKLVAEGYHVVRMDNRDVGLSTWLKDGDAYRVEDMAADAVGVLDTLGVEAAHVAGVSMGGMISQLVAADHPRRVRSLTSIMSTTGNPKIPGPTREATAVLMAPPPKSKEEYFVRFGQTWKVLRNGSFPEDEALDPERARRTFERGLNPEGVGRQLRAILASGSRKERLRSVKAPTLVIHGTIDPLVHPEGGKDTAVSIPGAKLLMIEGMGHALPIPMWPEIIDAIDKHAHGAAAKAA